VLADLPHILRTRTFRSLWERNYRLFFAGHTVSVIGTWMQRVAQDWLVLTLSGSALALGVSAALQFGPTLLLGMWGGVLVDRLDRRRTIICTQLVQAVLAGILAALTLSGSVQLWMVYLLTLALGVVTVVDSPARQAFAAEMVEPHDYVNAQSLGSTMNNTGRLVGPAVAGVLIAGVGVGTAFLVNAVSFLAVLASLLRMDVSRLRRIPPRRRAAGQLREGLSYVSRHSRLRLVMVMVLVVALLGQNFRVLLPLLARDTFHAGASTYGYLMAMLGLGAVLGGLVTASLQRATGWAVTLACLGFAAANLLAAMGTDLAVAYVAMAAVGYANITFNSLARTVLQVGSERFMHGRVLALHGLVFLGTTPLGGPLMGWICAAYGTRAAFVVAGAAPLVTALPLAARMRRLDRDELITGPTAE
jgi:MFS family permease